MRELAEYRGRLVAQYASQPQELERLVARIPVGRLSREIEPGGWSPHQILTHIRDVEVQAFVPRIGRIVAEDTPWLASFDPEAWMDQHYDGQEGAAEIVAEILRQRAAGKRWIDGLDSDGWSRTGEHPSYGVRTLQWWVEYSVAHFAEHLEQLARSAEGG